MVSTPNQIKRSPVQINLEVEFMTVSLHCSKSFIIILPSSRYDLNNVERGVKTKSSSWRNKNNVDQVNLFYHGIVYKDSGDPDLPVPFCFCSGLHCQPKERQTVLIQISWLQSQLIWIYFVCKSRVYPGSSVNQQSNYCSNMCQTARIIPL